MKTWLYSSYKNLHHLSQNILSPIYKKKNLKNYIISLKSNTILRIHCSQQNYKNCAACEQIQKDKIYIKAYFFISVQQNPIAASQKLGWKKLFYLLSKFFKFSIQNCYEECTVLQIRNITYTISVHIHISIRFTDKSSVKIKKSASLCIQKIK